MLDNLVREISGRWSLGDQGSALVQMLVAYIHRPGSGGLKGFLDQFNQAGLSGMAQTWTNPTSTVQTPTIAEIETVLGGQQGFLQQATQRLGLNRETVSAAVAGMLPMLIGRMTPGGVVPTTAPPEFESWIHKGQSLLGLGGAAAAGAYGAHAATDRAGLRDHTTPVAEERKGIAGWLPWLIAALVALFALSYCSKDRQSPPVTPSPATSERIETAPDAMAPPEASLNAPATSGAVGAADGTAASTDPAVGSHGADSASASSADAAAQTATPFTVPDGAGVVGEIHAGMPAVRVFFDTGKTDVDSAFAQQSQELVQFLNEHPDATAVISGFNDPTGDPARNAELSKQRAQAVQQALQAQGVASERMVLEKPVQTSDTGATNAESRRVDVILRR